MSVHCSEQETTLATALVGKKNSLFHPRTETLTCAFCIINDGSFGHFVLSFSIKSHVLT